MLHRGLATLAIATAITASVAGQDDRRSPTSSTIQVQVVDAERTSPSGSRWARTDGEVHGRLVHLRLDLEFDDAAPRKVRRALARALGLNLIDHFPKDDDATPGVSMSLRQVPALEALETLIALTSGPTPGTWQVREGILEVGPRGVLARRTPPITRVIEVTDLLLEPPDFVPTGIGRMVNPEAVIGQKTNRSKPRELGAKLLESIVQQVEPDAWRAITDAERADGLPDPIDPRDPFGGRNLDPDLRYPNSERLAPIFVQGRWASITLKDRAIIVRAPAFVLRGIEGLPRAVPPPASLIDG